VFVQPGDGMPIIIGCYHPSRQNTNTGKLTARMMEGVFRKARRLIDRSAPRSALLAERT
jgi:uracil-DNA glycosylase